MLTVPTRYFIVANWFGTQYRNNGLNMRSALNGVSASLKLPKSEGKSKLPDEP
jgi:hypothetical protein